MGAKDKVRKLTVISSMVLLGCKKDFNFDLGELTEFLKS